MFADAFVHSLVVATEQHEVILQRERVGHRLGKHLAVGGGVNNFIVAALAFEFLNAIGQRFDGHNHPGTAAVGIVVHTAVTGEGIVVEVVENYFHQPFLLCSFQNGFLKEHRHHVGEEGKNIQSHISVSLISDQDE